ncbi:MAG: hydrogenase iron-sulfur subunit [Planctomycetota bacterium]|nr:hydrogenase iron-sulfur subunit [Planctomycetota bacterium]
MNTDAPPERRKVLVLATLSGGYAGADAVGQSRAEYPCNVYILPVVSAAMFPEEFYLRAFQRGIDAILIMFSGADCPFKGAPERTAQIVSNTYERMKERGLDTRRLRLVAICTVCTKPFLREVNQINDVLEEIGPVGQELAAASVASEQHEATQS